MKKWLKQLRLDVTGREGESTLTPADKQRYTLAMVCLFVGLAIAALAVHWVLALVLGAVAARKLQIAWHKARDA